MNIVENDDSEWSKDLLNDEEAKKVIEEQWKRLKENEIKGFSVYQKLHEERFKNTQKK